jgi:hypothetical protein
VPTTPTLVLNPVCELISQIPGPDDGFPTPEIAEHWRYRGCGIACIRMILTTRGIEPDPYWSLIQEGVQAGSYCDRGWIHQGLVDMAQRRGIAGHAIRNAAIDDLTADVTRGSLLIASVTACFRGGQPHRSGHGTHQPGGHLVLVTGAAINHDRTTARLRVHHPSATPANNWADRWIDAAAFAASFSGAYLTFPPGSVASSR